jgi:hypothetical protein
MADVIPFVPPAIKTELDDLKARLGQCEAALHLASSTIRDLQRELESEKVMKSFYQDLATRRMQQIIALENLNG